MQAVRALYDGERLRPLPSESLPSVEEETLVIVIFDSPPSQMTDLHRLHLQQALQRMRSARSAMPLLEDSIREMIEDGRDRC